ncbi:MAG: hypothetical protein Q8885_01420 [Candidatus Phytoplasma stylosanthis]|nr:hypothetical protein [Candidatus Phytoplasma stylosanthis]
MSDNKIRIQYKNIYFEYKIKSFDGSILQTIKAFFLGLFLNVLKTNKIKYLIVSHDKENNKILVLLQLEKKPDWSSINKFIFNGIVPTVSNCLSPTETIEELILNNYVSDGFADVTLDVSQKPKSQQDKLADSFVRNLRDEIEESRENENPISLDVALKKFFNHMRKTKNYNEIKNSSIYTKYIEKLYDGQKDNSINEFKPSLSSFNLDNYLIQRLIKQILKEVEKVRRSKRPCFICVIGRAFIGKTVLIKTILREHNIPFNSMKEKLSYSTKTYDDNADVDIHDDMNYYAWDNNHENIQYSKMVVGCNQKDNMGWGNKYEKLMCLQKNKLSIFICNPDRKSNFKIWFENEKNPNYLYFKDLAKNATFIEFESEKPLYKIDKKTKEDGND